jgi:hypothetical protein
LLPHYSRRINQFDKIKNISLIATAIQSNFIARQFNLADLHLPVEITANVIGVACPTYGVAKVMSCIEKEKVALVRIDITAYLFQTRGRYFDPHTSIPRRFIVYENSRV